MMTEIGNLTWPAIRLTEALEKIARLEGLLTEGHPNTELPEFAPANSDRPSWTQWFHAASAAFGFDAEAVDTTYGGIAELIQVGAPALLRLSVNDKSVYLALIGRGKRTVKILSPEMKIEKIPVETIRRALCRDLELPLIEHTDE